MAEFHLGGLASGYDVKGIIENMMKVKAEPEKAWIEEQTEVEKDIAAWSDISSYMTTLTDSLDALRSSALWDTMAADASDETKLTAVASSTATEAIYTVGISVLAKAHTLASGYLSPSLGASTFADVAPATTPGATTNTMNGNGSAVSSSSWEATYDGVNTWTVVNTTTGVTAGTITAAPGAGGSIDLENSGGNGSTFTIGAPVAGTYSAGDKFTWTNAKRTSSTDLVAAGILTAGETFTIEGELVTIGATESLATLVGKINTAADSMPAATKVTASVLDNRLVIARDNTGSDTITMSDTSGSPLQDLGVVDGGGSYQYVLVTASNATFTVNGATVARSSNTNLTDVISGVTLNLLATTASDITLTVSADRDAAKTAILEFIDSYNSLAQKLVDYGKINMQGSDASGKGAQVSDKGELYNDSLVAQIAYNIRKQATDSKYPALNPINASYTYAGEDGVADSLEAIGVWTETRDNQLAVTNEDKLDFMLDNYFGEVEQLFRGIYDPVDGYENGVATDFYNYSDSVSASMSGDIADRVNALTDKSTDLEDQISKYDAYLEDYEQMLWEQFTWMDNTIAKLQSNLAGLQNLQKTS